MARRAAGYAELPAEDALASSPGRSVGRDDVLAGGGTSIPPEPAELKAATSSREEEATAEELAAEPADVKPEGGEEGGPVLCALRELCKGPDLSAPALSAALAALPSDAARTAALQEAYKTTDEWGDNVTTPLHDLCGNEKLTAEALGVAYDRAAPAAWGAQDKYGSTPLHWLCSNSKLTAEVLGVAYDRAASEAWGVQDRNGSTPLHWLCRNPKLTAEVLGVAYDRAAPDAWGVQDKNGNTPLHRHFENSALLTAEQYCTNVNMWTVQSDPLQSALVKNDTQLARKLVERLAKQPLPASQESGTDSGDSSVHHGTKLDPVSEDARHTIALAAVPNMVANLEALYAAGLGVQATELLREHGVAEPGQVKGYELYQPDEIHMREVSRCDLGADGMLPHGDDSPAPVGWLNSSRRKQDALATYEKLGSSDAVAVKPVVLTICGAGRAAEAGLLHVLTQERVPVAVFDTRLARLLVQHKWVAFGRRAFRHEVAVFGAMLAAWQALALLFAQHGGGAVVACASEGAAVAAVLASLTFFAWGLAEAVLPLAPRSAWPYAPISRRKDWYYGILNTLVWSSEGWKEDSKDKERMHWSPLGAAWRGAATLGDTDFDNCYGYCFRSLWCLVLLPTYFALALAARPAFPLAALALLGVTPPGLLALDSASLGGAAMVLLLATTARNAVQELRQADGGTRLSKKIVEEEAWLDYPSGSKCARVMCAAPFLIVKLLQIVILVLQAMAAHLRDLWNLLDLATLVLNYVVAFRVLSQADAVTTTQIAVANTLLMWLRSIQLLSGFDATAKYVSMFLAVTRDMKFFMLMIGIFVVSNGFALDLLYPNHLREGNTTVAEDQELAAWRGNIRDPDGVDGLAGTVPRAMFASFQMMLGSFEPALLDDAFSPTLAYAVFFEYTVVVTIVMLNLLIALMGGSYEQVAQSATLETLKQRAELILSFERMMSSKERNNPQWHPKYLHALVPADEVEEVTDEDGVLNGVKKLLAVERKAHEAEVKELKGLHEANQADVQELKDMVAKLMAALVDTNTATTDNDNEEAQNETLHDDDEAQNDAK